MFAKLHSDINSLKPGLLHFTSQLESRAAKVKMELETKFLGSISVINATSLFGSLFRK